MLTIAECVVLLFVILTLYAAAFQCWIRGFDERVLVYLLMALPFIAWGLLIAGGVA